MEQMNEESVAAIAESTAQQWANVRNAEYPEVNGAGVPFNRTTRTFLPNSATNSAAISGVQSREYVATNSTQVGQNSYFNYSSGNYSTSNYFTTNRYNGSAAYCGDPDCQQCFNAHGEPITPEVQLELDQERAERRERRRVQAAEEQAEYDRRRALRDECKRVANTLLLSLLDREQTIEYGLRDQFQFVGSLGTRFELTAYGCEGNIRKLDSDGMYLASYCCHPEGAHSLPQADVLVAQYLGLVTDEKGFLDLAHDY
jgi:hypothetical protein